jgi:hypothetical protein
VVDRRDARTAQETIGTGAMDPGPERSPM